MYPVLLFFFRNKKFHFILLNILLVFLFTLIYWLLGSSDNFHSLDNTDLTVVDSIYFALGTQTTLGYGDITAKSQLLRGIVILQILTILLQIAFAT